MVDAEKAANFGSRTILFVDEIHRFNKAQQDAFLPYVERGTIRLIGATTENPSFEIISALLSRCRVYTLQPLTEDEILTLLERASPTPNAASARMHLAADDDALALIASYSSGDARSAYNAPRNRRQARRHSTATAKHHRRRSPPKPCSSASCSTTSSGEEHYNLISALHKSIRNSDADASLYWLGRMLAAGEDPMYVARRLVRMAVEDIGLAAPEALNLTPLRPRRHGLSRLTRRRSRTRPGRRLSRARAQIERRLHRLRRSPRRHRNTPAPSPSRCTCATRPPGS